MNPPEGMVLIPGGTFEMGITKEDVNYLMRWGEEAGVPHIGIHAWSWFGDETPKHTVQVDSFYMDKFEVTNEQFERFINETGYRAKGKWREFVTKKRMNHPVVNVSWYDAEAYAEWVGKRLPTEENGSMQPQRRRRCKMVSLG